ncbi:MAG: hypothetical protein QXY49_04765 [Thermofilaceae archaeon]
MEVGFKQITCPSCNAQLKVPLAVSVVVCPYCGYTFEVSSGKKLAYYMFPIYVDSPTAWRVMMQFIIRRYGVPEDFTVEANPRFSELHFVPYYVFKCRASSYCIYSNRSASYLETADYPIPAAWTGTWIDKHLDNFSFSVRGKSFFDPRQAQKGKLHMPTVRYEEAYRAAYQLIEKRALKEARESCSGAARSENIEVGFIGLTHYPFWLMEYIYKGEVYRALLDASSGKVLYVEYPLRAKARAMRPTASAVIIGLGVASGLIVSIAVSPLGLIGGVITSAATAFPLLTKAFRSRARGSEAIIHRSVR